MWSQHILWDGHNDCYVPRDYHIMWSQPPMEFSQCDCYFPCGFPRNHIVTQQQNVHISLSLYYINPSFLPDCRRRLTDRDRVGSVSTGLSDGWGCMARPDWTWIAVTTVTFIDFLVITPHYWPIETKKSPWNAAFKISVIPTSIITCLISHTKIRFKQSNRDLDVSNCVMNTL